MNLLLSCGKVTCLLWAFYGFVQVPNSGEASDRQTDGRKTDNNSLNKCFKAPTNVTILGMNEKSSRSPDIYINSLQYRYNLCNYGRSRNGGRPLQFTAIAVNARNTRIALQGKKFHPTMLCIRPTV